jgi:hypothetical protein
MENWYWPSSLDSVGKMANPNLERVNRMLDEQDRTVESVPAPRRRKYTRHGCDIQKATTDPLMQLRSLENDFAE